MLISTSVCKHHLEPSVACAVHHHLGLAPGCLNFDLGNACLGFVNAIHLAATAIDAGQIDVRTDRRRRGLATHPAGDDRAPAGDRPGNGGRLRRVRQPHARLGRRGDGARQPRPQPGGAPARRRRLARRHAAPPDLRRRPRPHDDRHEGAARGRARARDGGLGRVGGRVRLAATASPGTSSTRSAPSTRGMLCATLGIDEARAPLTFPTAGKHRPGLDPVHARGRAGVRSPPASGCSAWAWAPASTPASPRSSGERRRRPRSLRGGSAAWASIRLVAQPAGAARRRPPAAGPRAGRVAAGRRCTAADGRLRARQPDLVAAVALVPPAPRRPLPRARRRPGLDGALASASRRGASRSASTISAASSTRFAVDGPVVLAAHDWGGPIALGWALEQRERVRGILLGNTGVAVPASGSAAADPARAARSACATSSAGAPPLFVRVDARDGPTAHRPRGRQSAPTSAPTATSRDRRAIADFVADIPTTPAHPSADALADVAARLPRARRCPSCSPGASATPSSTSSFAADLRRRGCRRPSCTASPSPGTSSSRRRTSRRSPTPGSSGCCEPQRAPAAAAGRRGRRPALWPRSSSARTTTRRPSRSVAAPPLRSRPSPGGWRALAEGLREAGVAPGDRVALLAPSRRTSSPPPTRAGRSGAVAVVVDRGLGVRGLARALRSAEPRWLLGTRKTLGVARALRWAPAARRLEHRRSARRRRRGSPPSSSAELGTRRRRAAAVVFTSGATGPAKGVLYDQQRMAAQFAGGPGLLRDRGRRPSRRRVRAVRPLRSGARDSGRRARLRHHEARARCAPTPSPMPALRSTPRSSSRRPPPSTACSPRRRRCRPRVARRSERCGSCSRRGTGAAARSLEAFGRLGPGRRAAHAVRDDRGRSPSPTSTWSRSSAVGAGRGVCVGHPVAGARSGSSRSRTVTARRARSSSGALAVARVRRPLGDDRSRAHDRRARESSGTARATSATSTRRGGCGSRAGSRTSSHRRRPGDAGAARDRRRPRPPALRCAVTGVGPAGCAQVVVVVESEGKAGSRRRASSTGPCAEALAAAGARRGADRAARSPSTAATTRRSTARGSAAGPARSSPAGRRRGGSDAGARHRRLRPARPQDDRGARRARARGRGAAAATRARSSTARRCSPTSATRRAVAGRRRGLRRSRPRCGARRRRRQPRDEFRRVNVGGTEAVVAACREAGVPRLVVVSSPSVGYESAPTVGAGGG